MNIRLLGKNKTPTPFTTEFLIECRLSYSLVVKGLDFFSAFVRYKKKQQKGQLKIRSFRSDPDHI